MPTNELRIESAGPTTDKAVVRAALELVLQTLPGEVRLPFIDNLLNAGPITPEGLGTSNIGEVWRAVAPTGELLGATWAQPRPGGSAVVWPPQWIAGRRPASPDPLLAALLTALAEQGFRSAESLLPDRHGDDAVALVECGFRHLADLCYLSVEVGDATALATTSPSELQFELVDAANLVRLASVVAATYRGTLDCPTLDDPRSPLEILDDYRRNGDSADRLWRLIRHRDTDVGCLILAEHGSRRQLELVYMGIVPEARGKNWGEATVREALQIAASRGMEHVVLAVDAENSPARAVYRRCGFAPFDTRSAFVCALPVARPNDA